VPAVSRLDFSLAGEIQKAAIVYFIWENLFDKKHYLTPYYPMPFRNIRFGVAWEFLN
jgi:outer membrane cobalamin receptor